MDWKLKGICPPEEDGSGGSLRFMEARDCDVKFMRTICGFVPCPAPTRPSGCAWISLHLLSSSPGGTQFPRIQNEALHWTYTHLLKDKHMKSCLAAGLAVDRVVFSGFAAASRCVFPRLSTGEKWNSSYYITLHQKHKIQVPPALFLGWGLIVPPDDWNPWILDQVPDREVLFGAGSRGSMSGRGSSYNPAQCPDVPCCFYSSSPWR